MTIIPSIDLLNGSCVRLLKGDYNAVTEYGNDPVAVAGEFEKAGAVRIHLVDLDAARGGGNNRGTIEKIRKSVGCVVEVGGGVRTDADVEELLNAGADRLIVGTVLARDPDTVASWIERYGSRFIAGIDADDGEVKVSGWAKGSGLLDTDLGKTAADIGAVSIVYTSIQKDGTMTGPDMPRTAAMADASGLPVIVSGGISSLADIAAVAGEHHPGIRGIISGKAIFEGVLNLREAVDNFQTHDTGLW